MLGAIVGDVIGSPFEHANVKSTAFRLFDRGAQCTDDSILIVARADGPRRIFYAIEFPG